MNDVISLALANAFARPIECMLSSPYQRTNSILVEAQLLLEFPLQCDLDRLTLLAAAARSNPPKLLLVIRQMDPEQKDLVLRREDDRTDCISFDDHYVIPTS